MFASLIAAMLLLAQTAWHANCPDVTAADFNSGRYDGQLTVRVECGKWVNRVD